MTEQTQPQGEPATGTAAERRAWVRFDCDLEASYEPAGAMKNAGWPAKVHDLSAGGVGLLLKHRFKPGSWLTLELKRPDGTLQHTIRVRVVHVNSVIADADPCWLTGCVFAAPLSESELAALL